MDGWGAATGLGGMDGWVDGLFVCLGREEEEVRRIFTVLFSHGNECNDTFSFYS